MGRQGPCSLAFTLLARRMRGVTTRVRWSVRSAVLFFIWAEAGGFCGADHGFRAGLDHDPARLPTQTEIRDRGTPGRPEGIPGTGQSWRRYGLCLLFPSQPYTGPAFLLALAAALSEAAADTVSSEIGQAFGEKARLITTWRLRPRGNRWRGQPDRNPGRSRGRRNREFGLRPRWAACPDSWLAISAGAAVLGMVADSFLGAWLERRALVNNDSVNFLGTLVAALAAFWLA